MPYMIGGEMAEVGTEPRLQDGTMWVPLRKLGQALGGNADWVAPNRVAVLYLNGQIITLTIGDQTADVDGERRELQGAPFVEDGETWVPVRLFESLGYTLSADPQNGIVDLSVPA